MIQTKAEKLKQARLNRESLYKSGSINNNEFKNWDDLNFIDFSHLCGINFLTPQQLEIASFAFDGKRRSLYVPAAHGVGKSVLSSIIMLYHVMVKHGLCIVTAPTARQVASIIFREANDKLSYMLRNYRHDILRIYGIDIAKKFQRGITFIREIDTDKKIDPLVEDNLIFDNSLYEQYHRNIDNISDDELSEEMEFNHSTVKHTTKIETLGYAYGYTAKSNDSSAFQGIHSKAGLKAIVDEASGVSQEIFDGVKSCVTGKNDLLLAIGNPTERNTAFHENCKKQQYVIDAFSHPNIRPFYKKTPDGRYVIKDNSYIDREPLISGAISPAWIESVRQEYGEKSLYWLTRVLATFPPKDSDLDRFFPDVTIDKLFLNELPPGYDLSDILTNSKMYVGIDIGRVRDQSAVVIGIDTKIKSDWLVPGIDPNEQITLIIFIRTFDFKSYYSSGDQFSSKYIDDIINVIKTQSALYRIPTENIHISLDNTSQSGSELGNNLIKIYNKHHVYGVSFASKPDVNGFYNKRASMGFQLRRLIDRSNLKIYTPLIAPPFLIERLKVELEAIKYTFYKGDSSRIIFNPKDDIKEVLAKKFKGVTSPDVSDASFLLANCIMIDG